MNFILVDFVNIKNNLLPLTYFRPVAGIRCGIFTLQEKWEYLLQQPVSCLTENYLQEKFPVHYESVNTYINAAVFADEKLLQAIDNLKTGEVLKKDESVIAFKAEVLNWQQAQEYKAKPVEYTGQVDGIFAPYDIFQKNKEQIQKDFQWITQNRTGESISPTNTVIGDYPVFLEKGVKMEACIINAEEGPVYFGKNVVILEGAMMRAPLAILDHAVIKMGAKIYNGTTIGPHCKVGGEVQGSVFFGYSNKGHDGYLGNSVIAEWCNLGADTNNSNLKNNYSKVKIWNYPQRDFVDTGLQFCGLIMADHSKSGIATMFNTGTVVGVSSNIFGGDYQPKFFPSFKWGGQKYVDYRFDKAIEAATAVMNRRKIDFDQVELKLFEEIYKLINLKEN